MTYPSCRFEEPNPAFDRLFVAAPQLDHELLVAAVPQHAETIAELRRSRDVFLL